ncbi:MAG: type ISP restriction/modification enzyme [Brevinema sp.]
MQEGLEKIVARYVSFLKLEGDEMANRTAFENMLKEVNQELRVSCMIIQDTSSDENKSNRIDFIIKNDNAEIAYVETKKIHVSHNELEKLLSSDQINRYRKHGHPLLFTNYIDFFLIDGDYISPLTSIARIEGNKIKSTKEQKDTEYGVLLNHLTHLFNSAPAPIVTVSSLARRLVFGTQQLRECIRVELDNVESPIAKAYENFKNLIGNMNKHDFASAYAETIAYGLIMIRLRYNKEKITLDNLLTKATLPIMSDLTFAIRNSEKSIQHTIDTILRLVNLIDCDAIQKELSYKMGNDKDPYIYLYEDFIQAYDPDIRKSRGVYYTPLPVVKYIVQAVDSVLKSKLGIRKGMKDNSVKLLDFAAGTGTFLLEAIRLVLEGESSSAQTQLVNEHILKNFYAFEYLMAPYAVAHLKTAQTLFELTNIYASPQIFLTNTLHNFEPPNYSNTILVELEKEGKKAHAVKNNEKILAIIGNPPYKGHSANTDVHVNWRDQAMGDSYFTYDGKPLDETNSKWLNDDYVKFIRFAQWKINQVDKGVVGLVTNHGFLDNPTFRGMRQSLMNTFDECYFLDLHGNSTRKEKAPDGSKDENVFPIKQGVAILIMIKNKDLPKKVYSGDLYGLQQDKFAWLENNTLESTPWVDIVPEIKSKYLFKHMDKTAEMIFQKYPFILPLKEIFSKSGVGIVTSRDHFAIAFTKEEIEKRLEDFCNPEISDEEIAYEYQLKDTNDWKLKNSRKSVSLLSEEERIQKIMSIDYRPFDSRWTFYDSSLLERPRTLVKNMLHKNIGLISNSATLKGNSHTFITKNILDFHIAGSSSYIFPLYLYENSMFPDEPVPNIQPSALKALAEYYGQTPTPEQLLFYIYAVLHHPTYRVDFTDLLRIDFPQVPFTKSWDNFKKLSSLGEELSKAHLLESFGTHQCKHNPDGGLKVEAPRYENRRLYYNSASYFDNVPQTVWELEIGGYKVLKEWLASRQGRDITLEESQKMEDIICSLVFAEEIINKIAEVGL